ncbi:DUF3352 domain-containing protein [Dehalococcoidia bacterium]|nr:DUF3352 domain-containing protein [Dehalococcoidia bacterium]
MKKIIAVIVFAILIAIGGVAAYIFLSLSSPPEQTAKFLPTNTAFYISANLRPGAGQLNQLRKIIPKFSNLSDGDDSIDEISDTLETETGIDILDDVSTWAGPEIALAVLEIRDYSDVPPIVAFVQTQDRMATQDTIDIFVQHMEKDGQIFRNGKAHGYKTIGLEEEGGNPGLHLALTEDFLVYASTDRLLGDTLARIQNNADSLYENVKFSTVRNESLDRFVFMYADTSRFIDALQEGLTELDPFIYSDIPWNDYGDSDFILTATVGLEEELVRVDFSVLGDIEVDMSNSMSSQNRLPEETVAYFSFPGLSKGWEQVKSQAILENDFLDIQEILDSFEAEIGISVDRDIFGWMTNETAFALLPSDLGNFGGSNVPEIDAVAFFQSDTDSSFESSIDLVRDALEQKGSIPFVDVKMAEYNASIVDMKDFTEDIVYEPWYIVFADGLGVGTTRQSMVRVIESASGQTKTLADKPTFKQSLQNSLQAPQAYIYLDIVGIRNMLEKSISTEDLATYERDIKQWVTPLNYLTVSGKISTNRADTRLILTFN